MSYKSSTSAAVAVSKMGLKRAGPPAMDPNKFYVNPGEEDQMEIQGYTRSTWRQVVTWFFIFLTVGLLRLFFHWLPHWFLWCCYRKCSLQQAEVVLLKDQYQQWFVEKLVTASQDGMRFEKHLRSSSVSYNTTGENLSRFFNNKKIKYVWNASNNVFSKLRGLEENVSCSFFHETCGLTTDDQARRRLDYGSNSIEVHVTPIIVLLFKEALNPFYIFQLFSVILWYFDEYWYYASCIILISAISLTTTIYQTRKMQRALRKTIHTMEQVTVCRLVEGEPVFVEVTSDTLVPGDVIEVPRNGCVMQCDAVLVSGNCIVNESMLTGESVPVTKTPIVKPHSEDMHEVKFDMKEHSRHTLFCGTKVIQTRYYGDQRVKAVVVRTGFMTAKGELVRSILFPRPVDFHFYQDTYKFVAFLAAVASFGFIFTVVLMVLREDEVGDIFLRALDMITIAVPPALPAALSVGIVFAQSRLKRKLVYCISPRSINICGSVNVVCFDKTGTLTEDGLDMWGIVPISMKSFDAVQPKGDSLPRGPLLSAMASCHSLTIIDGVINGDPLDIKMFEATNWELEEPGEDANKFDNIAPTVVRPKTPDIVRTSSQPDGEVPPYEVGILRQFTFSSSLQRMSVIARTLGHDHFELYAKGAPEMIASLCLPDTVPTDFHSTLMKYTQHGYRVIAMAYKPLKMTYVKAQRVVREQVECDLQFLGLLVLENRLKKETSPVIHQLQTANIKTIMVTGDNMLTAISVARECRILSESSNVIMVTAHPPVNNMPCQLEWSYAEHTEKHVVEISVDSYDKASITIEEGPNKFHFAMTGKSWGIIRQYFPELIPKLAVRGAVFARMAPEQKAQLVEALQELGYYVGMCGDGANDCGALKAAHTGISLSEAEASVASPFTSKTPNIQCVPQVIREGRCALVTSFGIFKYMACYSLSQFVSVLMLYWISNNLTDWEFLYIDLFLLTTLGITFGYTGPYAELHNEPPPVKLVSFLPIISVFLQTLVMGGVQTFIFLWVQMQPWFLPYIPNEDEDYTSHINYAVFSVSAFQYIILAVVFSQGAPYRKTLFSNYIFLVNLLLLLAASIYLVMYPFKELAALFELDPVPSIEYRVLLVAVAAANFLVCLIIEEFILNKSYEHCKCGRKDTNPYNLIEHEIKSSPHWPPITSSSNVEYMREDSQYALIGKSPDEEQVSIHHVSENNQQGDNVESEETVSSYL